ncbi:MAG TPA: hypothetical protein VN700_14385 [Vicinamibacterales bacterium]|nr:hypothetical protein [Vicinamibacterales bacterium]
MTRLLIGSTEAWVNVWGPAVGAVLGLLLFHYLLRPIGRYVWTAPESLHVAALIARDLVQSDLAAAQRERDAARSELAKQSASLEQVAISQSKAKAIAEALQPRLHHLTHHLANKVKSQGQKGDEWKTEMSTYEHEIKAEMEALNCSSRDINRFWDFTAADLAAIGVVRQDRDATWNERNQRAQFRINALREIIDKYLRLAGEKS